jgi:hypothetical protein
MRLRRRFAVDCVLIDNGCVHNKPSVVSLALARALQCLSSQMDHRVENVNDWATP